MSKQDRQGARTISDFERRYKIKETFAEMVGLSQEAKTSAEEAEKSASSANSSLEELNNSMTQEEVFDRLTKGGFAEALSLAITGQIWLNASYVNKGKLTCGSFELDFNTGAVNYSGSSLGSQLGIPIWVEAQVIFMSMGGMYGSQVASMLTKENFKRWYEVGAWTKEMLLEAYALDLLTDGEYEEITGEIPNG